MKYRMFRSALLAAFLGGLVAAPVLALEIITEEDMVQGVITEDQLVRVVDNAIFMLDTSSSMNEEFKDTGKTKIELVSSVFKKRNSYFPEIGHKFGIYTYTPWKEIYPIQIYNRQKVAAALNTVPTKGEGPTPIKKGLEELEGILKSGEMSGRVAVFVFSDGEYTGGNPSKIAEKLATNYDICFYVISTAKESIETTLEEDVAALNACSRVIPFEDYLNQPRYTSGALFNVVATEEIVTTTETRIVGLEVDNILFAFDESELTDKDKGELDKLGQFMKDKPESYAVIAGYTDNVGTENYNEGLSQRRTDMVASYLMSTHGIDKSRLVLQWYGSVNPVASNSTPEGRALNRRVDIAVGGL